MSLEIIRGTIRNNVAIQSLINALRQMECQGTFYAGYPIIASADTSHTIEALLVSPDCGIVAFNCPEPLDTIEATKDTQDQIYYLIEGNLKKHETLRRGRQLAITPNIVSFYPTDLDVPTNTDVHFQFAGPGTLPNVMSQFKSIDQDYYRPLCAAVQRITTIKPVKKRENVKKTDSKGAILKVIEKEIANLDQWQKKAAIEAPDGPQRVRGLAGSGKTVVLALKAAYLHAQHSDWDIVVAFNTRSLSQQFKDLIERFSLEHSGDKPNWDRLRILHAWGSIGEPGVYSEIADALKITPVNYATAKNKYGTSGAFEGICNELLSYMLQTPSQPIYDAVLIDEAQDLPIPFFRMVYAATKQPKRIVWAYDELQNLSNFTMPSVEDMFGKDKNGAALVSVHNDDNEAQQDIILPVCYRNTPWALTLAHALGFGIYRSAGLVQLFDELNLWKEIGYNIDAGTLSFNHSVTLKRRTDSFPPYLMELIPPDDAIIAKKFETCIEQYEWVASEIKRNITDEELDPDDILVIFPNAYTSKQQFQAFNQSLVRRGLNVHLAGVSTDRDVFTRINSITAASIYRAKGNESPMVYVVNSEWCASGQEMIRLRNILFTAITRSRAWVRICGIGDEMGVLEQEISKVRENDYKLVFKVPTQEELKGIRLINRDRTVEEKGKISKAIKSMKEIKELIDSGVLNPDMLPELKALLDSVKSNDTTGDELDEE
ncbi:MAG: ATP-binding domain-containing protein [Victivallaceae bacterium]|jgi:superfamily I DNA and RNA helicase